LTSYEYKDQGNYNDGNLVGTDGNDLIFGEKGNDIILGSMGDDVIYGGEGDDHITGGLGNDLLYGGAGNDTYYVNAGDGVDTIEDKEGNNRVILCGREINFFYEAGDGTYKSPDGKLTGVMPGGDFIVTGPDGVTKVILNEDFQWGDFGINLRPGPDVIPELPELELSNTITGDLKPIDADPEEEGVQYSYDEWGNVKCTEESESGRADTLYDTPESDKIEGLGGNDRIIVRHGNGDWVLGGSGNDYISISASGNILVEGGTGDDDIYTTADTLNARIYGGDGDDVITTMSNGSGWLYGGDGWDIIDGNMFDNCIIEGGPGSDIIWGAAGETDVNRLFADSYGEMEDFIEAGEIAPSTNQRGEIIGGAALGGNYIYGSDGYDILISGGGKDLIVGGGGDDLIMSDFGGSFFTDRGDNYTWAFTIEVIGDSYRPVITGVTGISPKEIDGDDDVIYAGTGNDFVYAGGGDDEVYGGAGNDTVFGMEGNDFIEGGAGDDILVGDNG
jgi:Ca2+-binding RTX toxin-like protein